VAVSTWSALGNVYVVAEGEALTPEGARELSAGADGVVEVVARDEDSAHVVIWNADGSQTELSGNGTRIAACWLAEQTGAGTVSIHVGARTVVARMLGDGMVEQELGDVQVLPRERIDGLDVVPVLVGNPHAVVQGDPADVLEIGPRLETHPRFPNRTNVQVVRVERPGEVSARVWERGVGETQASGTSAVAVAAATHGEGTVVVHFPGGDLEVSLQGGRALLRGPAARVG
jgi:diaminopimelate epimerase